MRSLIMTYSLKNIVLTTLIFLGSSLISVCAQAGVIPVVNAGFEAPVLPEDDFTTNFNNSGNPNFIPGWTNLNSPAVGGVGHPPFAASPSLIQTIDTAPEGDQIGFSRNGSGLFQVLSTNFNPDLTYTLTVQAALSSLSAALSLPGVDMGYRIAIGVDGVGTLVSETYTESTGTPRDDQFRLVSATWSPGDFAPLGASGNPLTISLITHNAGNVGGGSVGAAFDDVQLTSTGAVPEPSSFFLMIVSITVVLCFMQKIQSRTP